MGLPHWDEVGGPWDGLQLGVYLMPGVWKIGGDGCSRQVDHKKTKNKDGARIKDLGVLPARFNARGTMVSMADWATLQTIIPDINPKKKGGLRFPLAIFHPAVALLGITTIYVEKVRPPEVDERGIMTIEIDMIEWTAEPKATKTSSAVALPAGYVGIDEDKAILQAQNQSWAQRRAGITSNVGDGRPPGGETPDEEFARLTGGDSRKPPSSTAVAEIDPGMANVRL